ncbi:MAG: acyltransferase [Lachnospiraceae bacterium]|nr:acyltransferase [Lachnospiraceae bacterium]
MSLKGKLNYAYHVLIKRDVMPFWKEKNFGHWGQGAQMMYPVTALEGTGHMSVGDNTRINKFARLQCYSQNGADGKIILGKGCYIGFRFTILSGPGAQVCLGDDVLIASDVMISSENHGMNPEDSTPYMDQPLTSASVEIGDGCWIGEKVCIMPGVTIGKKSVIGAGSVVTKSIPDYSIAVGNPARVIKRYDFDMHKWVKANNSEE